VDVHLAAVQVAWSAALYASPETFRERMLQLGAAAVSGAHAGPRLIAFPELIALPLVLTVRGDPRALRAATFGGAVAALARPDAMHWLASAWRRRSLSLIGAVTGSSAVPAYRLWFETFAAVARATDAVVVAGSAFFPDVDDEPSRGWHVRDARVHNAALTFSPSGQLLGRTAKVHFTPGTERQIGLTPGRVDDLDVMYTPAGRVGVAVCLDGFHERVIATLDGRGAQIVVQPSANDAAWDRPWPGDPTRTEGEVWLADGLRHRIQGRSNVRYGVNPMMVGDAFGLRPRGRSSIVANLDAVADARPRCDDLPAGIVAIAADANSEAIVTARVSLPDLVTYGEGQI